MYKRWRRQVGEIIKFIIHKLLSAFRNRSNFDFLSIQMALTESDGVLSCEVLSSQLEKEQQKNAN